MLSELPWVETRAGVRQRHRHVGDELIFLIEGANGFIHAHGPRVAESGLGVLTGWAFSAPYEDLKLKGK